MFNVRILNDCKERWLQAWCSAVAMLFFSFSAHGVTSSDFDPPQGSLHTYPYLGVGEYFGRWENGIVPIGYNHSGARPEVSAAEMIGRIEAAFEVIESVADIRFEFVGETSREMLDYQDGLVVMGWDYSEDAFAARAGPRGNFQYETQVRIGYYPYSDGRVTFNSASTSGHPVPLILHELLHLLGFGHSENPLSLMTPQASVFSTLQPDDISGLQAVYGPPDVFVAPGGTGGLAAGPVAGVDIFHSESGFHVSPASAEGVEGMRPVTLLDSSYSPDDWVIFRISYRGLPVGAGITHYITPPSGIPAASDPFTVSYSDGYVYFFVGYVEEVLNFPGNWQTELAVDGTRLFQDELQVDSAGAPFNRTPTVALRVDHEDDEYFRMYLDIADPEGDSTVIDWMYPSAGTIYDASDDSLLWKGAMSVGARQVFIQVRDEVDRDPPDVQAGSAYGPGFGNVVSRWLAVPAEPDTPTFFADTGILHIPSLDLNGTVVTANFKLTALEGIVLKFLEFDPLTAFAGIPAGQYRDGTGTLTLAKLIVYDQGQKFHFTNAVFRVIPDSSPIKMQLTGVDG